MISITKESYENYIRLLEKESLAMKEDWMKDFRLFLEEKYEDDPEGEVKNIYFSFQIWLRWNFSRRKYSVSGYEVHEYLTTLWGPSENNIWKGHREKKE